MRTQYLMRRIQNTYGHTAGACVSACEEGATATQGRYGINESRECASLIFLSPNETSTSRSDRLLSDISIVALDASAGQPDEERIIETSRIDGRIPRAPDSANSSEGLTQSSLQPDDVNLKLIRRGVTEDIITCAASRQFGQQGMELPYR